MGTVSAADHVPKMTPQEMREDLTYARDVWKPQDKSFSPAQTREFDRIMDHAIAIANADSLDPLGFWMSLSRALAVSGNGHTHVEADDPPFPGLGYLRIPALLNRLRIARSATETELTLRLRSGESRRVTLPLASEPDPAAEQENWPALMPATASRKGRWARVLDSVKSVPLTYQAPVDVSTHWLGQDTRGVRRLPGS